MVHVGCCVVSTHTHSLWAPYCIADKTTYVEVLMKTRTIGRFTSSFLSSRFIHPLTEYNVVVGAYFSLCDLLIILALSKTMFSCLTHHNPHTSSYRGILRMYLWYFKWKGVNVGNPWHKNTVSELDLCCHDREMLAKSANIWLSGQHVANMSATFSAKWSK